MDGPTHDPNPARYESMTFRRCGSSGLKLPALALGAWETFGTTCDRDVAAQCFFTAFDHGVTHFDFANNYGNPAGNAETMCRPILAALPRNEIIVATKAGYPMWPGPYGDGGSRKYLIASCDDSLRRLGLDYVDIFYHHRQDPDTPLEETIGALATLVSQGKALYVGLSTYDASRLVAAVEIAADLGVPLTILQPYFNVLGRAIEADVLPAAQAAGLGVIAFCPLASGLLTDRYLDGNLPEGSRALIWPGRWVRSHEPAERSRILQGLAAIAAERDQSLAEMALSWVHHHPLVTAAVAGASRPEQVVSSVRAMAAPDFSDDERARIDALTLP